VLSGRGLLGLALLSLAAGGCASLRGAADTPAPVLNANVPTANQLAAPYRAQAEQREREGALRQAVEAWMTALALAPDHEPSRAALQRLRERIEREISQHLQRGWHAVARDASAEARRHFLAALALDPDSRPAQEALRATPAGRAAEPGAEGKPAALVVRPAVLTPADGRVEGARPESIPGTTEKPEALYAAARTHLAEGRDEDAYRALVQLTRVNSGFGDAARLLRDLRPRLVRQRYREGLRLFRDERIEDAIEKWRGVLELEPGHAHARRNIEQAEKMLRTLAAQPKR
jgi:tetratricopeptide (TPR) repeat protein